MATHPFFGATRSGQGNTEFRANIVTSENKKSEWHVSVTIHVARKDGSRISDDDHIEIDQTFETEQEALNAGLTAASAWGLRR